MADDNTPGGVVRRLYAEFILVDRASSQLTVLNERLTKLEEAADGAGGAEEGVGDSAGPAGNGVEKFGNESESASRKTDSLRNTLLGLGAAFTTVGVAGALYFSTVAKDYGTYAKTLAAYNTMAGDSASDMLASMTAATAGTISNAELVQKSNMAMAMGIDKEYLPKLLEISTAASGLMGIEMDHALESIITGVARGSAQWLDNLGIIVDLDSAYEKYANEIGKTASALTKEERTAAMLNEVIDKGQVLIDKSGTTADNAATAHARLDASLQNMNITMGAAASGPMTAWYNMLAGLADIVSGLPGPLVSIIATLGMAVSAVAGLVGPLMLQAAAVLFLRQQWVQFRAGLALTPLFAGIAQGGLAGLTASLYATAAAAWAALVPLLPLIAGVAALGGIAVALDYGMNGDKSLIGTLLTPAATGDTLSTTNNYVVQNNNITQNNSITTSQGITEAEADRFLKRAKTYLQQENTDLLKRELGSYF